MDRCRSEAWAQPALSTEGGRDVRFPRRSDGRTACRRIAEHLRPINRHPTAADLALGCFRQVVAWLPDDGSTHEGPGYWDYGYHWIVRTGKLIDHVTGVDPTAGATHFSNDHLYRLYMTAPGWGSTFNIGDANEAPPSNAEGWMPGIALTRDAPAESVAQPGSIGALPGLKLRSLPGCIEVTVLDNSARSVVLSAYALSGRLVKRWSISGGATYVLSTRELMTGACLMRIESQDRSGSLRVVRMVGSGL